MEKLKCLIYAPINEYSFYGDKSRLFIKHLIKERPDFDIRIVEYQSFHTKNGKIDSELMKLVQEPWKEPEVCFFFSSPSLYKKIGTKANIAFVNTCDICTMDDVKLYIDRCNLMNAVVVSSGYAQNTLRDLAYKVDNEEVKITVPVCMVTEFSEIIDLKNTKESILSAVHTSKNFLLEGKWDLGTSDNFGGKNRDNISYIVRNFLEAFKDNKDAPGLILNVHGNLPGIVDVDGLNKKLNAVINAVSFTSSLPKVYLLNGILEPEQVKSLYNDPKVIAYIHAPQRTDTIQPELNFINTGKPMVLSGFGSQAEALNYAGNIMVNCEIKNLTISNVEKGTPKVADIYGDYLKYAFYEIIHHYDDLKKYATLNSHEFMKSNTKQRSLNLFMGYINDLVPVKKEPKQEVKEES
jgi:hypothetical protein